MDEHDDAADQQAAGSMIVPSVTGSGGRGAGDLSSDQNRKRRRSDDACLSEGPAAKFLIETPPFNLQEFSDEILCEIFGHVDGNTLFHISRTCYRFYNLIQDYRFWKQIDLTCTQLSVSEIMKRLKWMGQHTTKIQIRGLTETFPLGKWKNETVTVSLLSHISTQAIHLHTLELNSAYLNMEKICMAYFPKTLKRLVFNNCNVLWPRNTRSFFTEMDAHLELLEELAIEYCVWFEPYDLMVFSKIKNLRWLSLRGCSNLKDFVPYGSMSTRFGFKKLEYLDIRNTPITDSDVQCFNCVETLREMLLECPTDMVDREKIEDCRTRNEMPSSSRSTPAGRNDDTEESDDEVESVNGQEREDPRMQSNRFSINPDRMFYVTLDDRLRQIQGLAGEEEDVNVPPQRVQVPVVRFENIRDIVNLFQRNSSGTMPCHFNPPRICPISNLGICSFGRAPNPVQIGVVCIRFASRPADNRPADNSFQKLTVRHYKLVTDLALSHLVQCSPNLVYLDITGTGVSEAGVQSFKAAKPECYIISDHFIG